MAKPTIHQSLHAFGETVSTRAKTLTKSPRAVSAFLNLSCLIGLCVTIYGISQIYIPAAWIIGGQMISVCSFIAYRGLRNASKRSR